MDSKICTKCGEEKTLDYFNCNKFNDDGLYNECISCVNVYAVQKRKTKNISKSSRFKKLDKDGDGDFFSTKNSRRFIGSMSWRNLRYELLKESNRTCCVCGRTRERHNIALQVDHIIPKSVDWSKRLDKNNLQVLCEDCNIGKGNKDSIDWR